MGNLWSDFIGAQKWRWLGLMAVAFVSIAAITYCTGISEDVEVLDGAYSSHSADPLWVGWYDQ